MLLVFSHGSNSWMSDAMADAAFFRQQKFIDVEGLRPFANADPAAALSAKANTRARCAGA